MSAPLSKELRIKYQIRTMPVRKDDEVQVMRGHFKGQQVGKVTQVYRKRYCLYIERIQREKANGTTVPVAIHPSKVIIVKLKIDKNRKQTIERRAKGRAAKLLLKGKTKYTEQTATAMDTTTAPGAAPTGATTPPSSPGAPPTQTTPVAEASA